MPKSAADAAKNWQSAMANPQTSQRYKDGIARFQGNPMALAAAPDAQARYAASTAAAVSSGRMAQKLNAADVNQWRSNASGVGAQRLQSGAQKGAQKQAAAMQRLAPVWQQMSDAVKGMPKGGLANAQARSNAALAVLMQATGKA